MFILISRLAAASVFRGNLSGDWTLTPETRSSLRLSARPDLKPYGFCLDTDIFCLDFCRQFGIISPTGGDKNRSLEKRDRISRCSRFCRSQGFGGKPIKASPPGLQNPEICFILGPHWPPGLKPGAFYTERCPSGRRSATGNRVYC